MEMLIRQFRNRRRKYDLISCFLPAFSFLWAILSSFSFPGGTGTLAVLVLTSVSIFSLALNIKIDRQLFFSWIWFFIALVCRIPGSSKSTILLDLTVYFSAWMFCACGANKKTDPQKTMKMVYLLGVIVGVLLFADILTKVFSVSMSSLYNESAQRVKRRIAHSEGLFAYSAITGGFLVSGLGAGFFLQRSGKKTSVLWYCILVLYIAAIIYINKRAFILDIAIAVFVFYCIHFLEKRKSYKIQWKTTLVYIIIGVILIALLVSNPIVNKAANEIVVKFTNGDTTLSGRTNLYKLAIDHFLSHPIMGIGWGKYRESTQGYLNSTVLTYETHNVYLQLLSETGIIGISSFLWAVFSTLFRTIKKYKKSLKSNDKMLQSTYGLALFQQLFFLTYCLSGNPLYDYNFVIMYFSGVALSAY